jgi:hypothetical protein
MPISERENWFRTVEFRYPEWIPCRVGFSPITWRLHRPALEAIIARHPRIFVDYDPETADDYHEMPAVYRQGEYLRDNWGCLWYNMQDGLEGQVVEHPLADWSALDSYSPPDPMLLAERGPRDWAEIEEEIAEREAQGRPTYGGGERLFDRLYFLRGWENLMMDFATEPPELGRLIAMLEEYELKLIRRWLEIGVDVIGFHTDIGTQKGLMISPASFRKHLKPMFRRLFQTCRQGGSHVLLSSDGNLLEIVDDLVECGVSIHDPQLRACTLEGIARAYKGKMCVNLDMDRQGFPFMTPAELRQQVKDIVDVLGSPEGGLMVMASVSGGDVPMPNIEAICEAMEDYCLV